MAYQFVHLDSWSRKPDRHGRSTAFVFDEAARIPAASLHVENPCPPTNVFGVHIDEVRAMHDAAAEIAMAPGPRGKLRKIRRDQKTLHTVVASHPYTVDEVRSDTSKLTEIREWERLTIDWLQSQYGPALKSVIRHTDERQWHIHAYILNSRDPQLRAIGYHPGVVAKRAVKAAGPLSGEDAKTLNKRADRAYQGAMRGWQDSYHDAVAVRCGLTRLGPARRRLTRAEWHAEQTQAAALKNALERASEIDRRGRAFINRTKAEAEAMKADAADIMRTAERYHGIGGAIRSAVDGIQESRIRAEIRRGFVADLDAARAIASSATAEATKERAARQESEKRAADARHIHRQHAQNLAAARQEIRRLSSALAVALEEPAPFRGGMAP
jgi:hypothetical protein